MTLYSTGWRCFGFLYAVREADSGHGSFSFAGVPQAAQLRGLYCCDAVWPRVTVEFLNLHTPDFPVFNSHSVADFGIRKHFMKLGRQEE